VDVEQPVGQALSRILAPGPDAERSIDAFIEKRHAERVRREGDRRVEEAWKDRRASTPPSSASKPASSGTPTTPARPNASDAPSRT
jgi:hypothetical protein